LRAGDGRLHPVPRIDEGSAETGPGRSLKNAWVTLTEREAHDVLEALRVWAEETASGRPDPQWHTHVTDADGNELTIAIGSADDG
jgi:hypothetical protein